MGLYWSDIGGNSEYTRKNLDILIEKGVLNIQEGVTNNLS